MLSSLRRCWPLAALSATLLACSTPRPAPGPETAEPAQSELALHREAQEMLAGGRVLAAIRLYRELAERSASPQQEKILLDNVSLLLEHGYPELAQDGLAPLELASLDPELDTYRRALQAELALTLDQPQLALDSLPDPQSASTGNVKAQILSTRARALARLGRKIDSLRDYAALEGQLGEPAAVEAARQQLWQLLQNLPPELLEPLTAGADTDPVAGWARLAAVLRAAPLQPQGLRQAVAEWRAAHPAHPAAREFADRLVDELFAAQDYPERVAVLLPFSGRLAVFAEAVREGILSAYYDTHAEQVRPELLFYDVGEQGLDAVTAYREAVRAGSALVLGPLDKESLNALAALGELPTPLLSLNYLDTQSPNAPAGLYQFGLLPEDEAVTAAQTAIAEGLRRAIVLVPESPWGRRMLESFSAEFVQLGGQVLDAASFRIDGNDFARPIRRVLGIDHSEARDLDLRQILGKRAKFEPRRRQDIDLVFIAADPRQARLLKPQLKFHRADDLPVYATSRAYAGQPSPDEDVDLEGLYFCDLPWLLEDALQASARYQRVAGLWPGLTQDYARLLALGMDAYEIIPFLRRLELQRGTAYEGRTGSLWLDPSGRLHRRLQWGQFVAGQPRAVRLAAHAGPDPLARPAAPAPQR